MGDKDSKKTAKHVKELETKIDQLQQQLDAVTAEKQETFEQLQRISADYANFQKRSPKQIADSVAYEKKNILRSLLPSVDNFEHALSHAETFSDQAGMDNVIKGLRMVFDHMLEALKSHGVRRMDALGEPFDPTLHEAMMRRSEPDAADNTVLEVYQAGYLIGEQVLRPSKVIVNKIETPPPATDDDSAADREDANDANEPGDPGEQDA